MRSKSCLNFYKSHNKRNKCSECLGALILDFRGRQQRQTPSSFLIKASIKPGSVSFKKQLKIISIFSDEAWQGVKFIFMTKFLCFAARGFC